MSDIEDVVRKIEADYAATGSPYTEAETLRRLYELLRQADVGRVVDAIGLPDVHDAFVAYLRELHGERPAYDVVHISSTPVRPMPREVADGVHQWIRAMDARGRR